MSDLQRQEENLPVFSNEQNFMLAQRIAKSLASSELVPKMYQNNISNCLIALELANRMNASPLMVMQNLDVIQGKPSFSAKFLISAINSCGRYESIRYKFTDGKSLKGLVYTEYVWEGSKKVPKQKTFADDVKNVECIAWTREKGKDEVLESSPISIEMAIKEGWYTKDNSKWRTMPTLMLQYRAASFWNRVYAPELTMGMSTTEEVIDTDYTVVESTLQNGAKKASSLSEKLSQYVPSEGDSSTTGANEPFAANEPVPAEATTTAPPTHFDTKNEDGSPKLF
jgi:hypothetical protein